MHGNSLGIGVGISGNVGIGLGFPEGRYRIQFAANVDMGAREPSTDWPRQKQSGSIVCSAETASSPSHSLKYKAHSEFFSQRRERRVPSRPQSSGQNQPPRSGARETCRHQFVRASLLQRRQAPKRALSAPSVASLADGTAGITALRLGGRDDPECFGSEHALDRVVSDRGGRSKRPCNVSRCGLLGRDVSESRCCADVILDRRRRSNCTAHVPRLGLKARNLTQSLVTLDRACD